MKTKKKKSKRNPKDVLETLENIAQSCAETLKLSHITDYFGGPDIPEDITFFESQEELNYYVQAL